MLSSQLRRCSYLKWPDVMMMFKRPLLNSCFQEVKVNWASTPSSQKKDTSSKCRPLIFMSLFHVIACQIVCVIKTVLLLSLQITSMCLSEI